MGDEVTAHENDARRVIQSGGQVAYSTVRGLLSALNAFERDRISFEQAITWGDEKISRLTDQLAAAQSVITEALKSHREREYRPLDGTYLGGTVCNHCRTDYPCETVRMLSQSPTDALQAVKEAAWDEGYTVGNAHNGRREANPYRKDKTDE